MDLVICKDCGKEFRKHAKLQRHIRETHQNLKPFKCEICQKEFKRKSHLKRHETSHSDNPKPLACTMEDCTQRFSNKYHLARHVKIVHDQDRYRCRLCETTFKKKRFLQKHMADVHSSFYTEESLDSIETPVYSEQPFISAEFSQKRVKMGNNYLINLKSQQLFLADDQYEVVFNSNNDSKDSDFMNLDFDELLSALKDIDESQQPASQVLQNRQVFKCGYGDCCKTFLNLRRLKLHMRASHIKTKPFKCERPGCKASFRQKSSLNRHCSEKHIKMLEQSNTPIFPCWSTASDCFEVSRPSFTDFLSFEDACYDFLQNSPLRYNLSIRQDELDNL